MSPLFITLGMLVRTIFILIPKFSKGDLWKIGIAIVFGIALAGKVEDLMATPIGFTIVIAFFYKDILLPKITEGTLLLHGLVGLFIWNHTRSNFDELSNLSIAIGASLLIFSILICLLCFISKRIGFFLQTTFYTFFLAFNCYIAYQTSIYFLTHDVSVFGQLLLGFYGLTFVSSILYILNLIPIPLSKRQNFKQRFEQVKMHARDLAEAYFDIDSNRLHTIGILCIAASLPLFTYLGLDWITVCAGALVIGSFLAAPKMPSKFMPKSEVDKM